MLHRATGPEAGRYKIEVFLSIVHKEQTDLSTQRLRRDDNGRSEWSILNHTGGGSSPMDKTMKDVQMRIREGEKFKLRQIVGLICPNCALENPVRQEADQ